jgi:hypothetical protein
MAEMPVAARTTARTITLATVGMSALGVRAMTLLTSATEGKITASDTTGTSRMSTAVGTPATPVCHQQKRSKQYQ